MLILYEYECWIAVWNMQTTRQSYSKINPIQPHVIHLSNAQAECRLSVDYSLAEILSIPHTLHEADARGGATLALH